MIKKSLLILLLFISCSSYQTEYEEDMIYQHQKFHGLKFSDDPADLSSIIILIKSECKVITDQIEIFNNDGLDLEGVIDINYKELRSISKSRDEKAEKRILNNTPDDVQEYMTTLYKYCNLEDIFLDNWISLSKREDSYNELS
tara:strand:- start:454 stop:882 length:429 start_codon:yes stop_codon:yes gene_type:complete